jgi:hypothetical protein
MVMVAANATPEIFTQGSMYKYTKHTEQGLYV